MKLWVLRHAPVLLPPGLCYGASDVPPDEAATLEAARLASAALPHGLPVWVSALGRAGRLAQHLHLQRPDLGPATVDARLNEMNFGSWELRHWDSIPRSAIDAWTADFDHHRFGGAESTRAVVRRVASALADLRTGVGDSGQALWITHAGVIRALRHLAARGDVPVGEAARWPADAVPHGTLTSLTFTWPGSVRLP
ncbi:MAG: histidine phosphatase family protein [Pseudomonadota bacterium]